MHEKLDAGITFQKYIKLAGNKPHSWLLFIKENITAFYRQLLKNIQPRNKSFTLSGTELDIIKVYYSQFPQYCNAFKNLYLMHDFLFHSKKNCIHICYYGFTLDRKGRNIFQSTFPIKMKKVHINILRKKHGTKEQRHGIKN